MATGATENDENVPERFDPDEPVPSLMKAEHWARYQLAAGLAAGRNVLDAGCGTGYGTRLLESSGARDVTGLDVSSEALDAARRRLAGATLVQADLTDTGLPTGAFDLITCFEVIEHLEEHEELIRELDRLLSPTGILLISSPNRDVYLAGNPHHVRELIPDELDGLLACRFAHVTHLRQHPWTASAILGTGTHESSDPSVAGEAAVIKTDGIDAGRETYTIALASNEALPNVRELVALSEATELSDYSDAIRALERRIGEVTDALERAGELRFAAEQRQRDAELDLAETRDHLRRANEAISAITNSTSWRVTAPLRRLRRMKQK